jgi:S1-C subfamily serine protease
VIARSTVSRGAALLAAGLLGGLVALGGVAATGGLGGATTTVIERPLGSAPAAPRASGTGGLSVNEIYRRSAPGVVQITSTSIRESEPDRFFGTRLGPSRRTEQALGSGFVIDKAGHVVTNHHVVEGASDIEVSFSNEDTLRARIVGSDPSTDLTVLRVVASARALTPLTLGDSDAVRVGDAVVAIGNPFGLDRTATAGIVSALQRDLTAPNGVTIDHVIQTDAPINSGSSGGPLLNARGEVVGVNSQISTAAGNAGNIGIGFAVPSNTVKTVIGQLIDRGRVDRAYLGIGAATIEPELARLFGLPVDSGLLVEVVGQGSPAARAGLRGGDTEVVVAGESYRLGGDLIVAVDRRPVVSLEQLRGVLAAKQPGDAIQIELYRGDVKRTLKVTLGRQPASP